MDNCSNRAGPLLPVSKRRPRAVYPSTGLLSLLAAVASSEPVVDAKPLNFLCPLVDLPEKRHLSPRRHVPDKYEQGEDGLWRQAESYSLYGSTMCKNCAQTSTPTPSSSVPSASPSLDMLNDLPPGWQPQTHENRRTSLILALSLVLAFFICFLIIGCMFWRKNRRKKVRSQDIEMITRRSRHDDGERLIEQEIQAKKKLWAKAAARWKANVRHSARRRRGRRRPPPQHVEAETTSISIHPQDPSRVSLPSSSRHSIEVTTIATAPESDHPEITFSPPPTPPIPLSPPAYRQRSAIAAAAKPSSSLNPQDPASSSSSASDEYSGMPSVHTAHVATDDKTVLEHLSSLANSPPSRDLSRLSDSIPLSSAPVWQDEELDEFDYPVSSESSSESQTQQSIWPSPPSKGKMAAHYDFEYSYSFDDDISALEPEAEPSAPPFEGPDTYGASAPPLEEVDASVPSAPDVSVLDVT